MRTKNKIAATHTIVDIAGVGINATDTIIRLPHFPTLDSKVELASAEILPGGQVASAMVACQRWGLRARYSGKVGDDAAGKFQQKEMEREGVEAHWVMAPGCSSQIAYILVDKISGERTVLWKRDAKIALRPKDIQRNWVSGARLLLLDGHDTFAATRAATWAREEKIQVVGDFDNIYRGVQALLALTDYPVTSRDFPERLTGEPDLLKSLPQIFHEFKCRLTCATIGRLGAIAWDGRKFLLAPGFQVRAIDTTGAGDIFHGAFAYGLVKGWPAVDVLEFSCAAAALNCTAVGARGGIATLLEINRLRLGGRRSEPAFSPRELEAAAAAAHAAGLTRNPPPHLDRAVE